MLHLHRSERADALVGPLAAVLAEPPEDPFTRDLVAVPTRGVERWLAQRLSHHLGAGGDGEAGVCANVHFDSPGRLVREALVATGVAPDEDPWDAEHLVWHLLAVVDACAGEAWCSALGRHLGMGLAPEDVRRGRRLQAAQHLAALLGRYAAERPDMVLAWAEGRDDDGHGGPVPEDLRWQPELWRRLRAHLGSPGPAERLAEATARITDHAGAVDLPARLSVFGPTRLPEDQLRVLGALARHRDVHLWLPHPSPVLWDAVGATAPVDRRRVPVAPARHPMLASMARDAAELQSRLLATGQDRRTEHHPAAPPSATAAPSAATTLLAALQERLRDDAPDAPPVPLADGDRSVQVHACHGRARQVEVLREALIGLFADDPTLEPRDVIVMCPDIEAVAPLVTATFGLHEADAEPGGHPGRGLRVRLADRGLRQTNPLLDLLARVLDLADGRVTASDVVDLVTTAPVRHRFGFDDGDVDRIRGWVVDAGVRWGEDQQRREAFGLGHVRQGTWRTALDRLLLGVAMADEDDRSLGVVLPLDDVPSTDVDLAGRLAELVERLAGVLADLTGTQPLAGWISALDRALVLLAATDVTAGWQRVEAQGVLDDVRRSAARAGTAPDLRLADVRALLARRLGGRPTRAGFRTGALTVCSLEPMRAVPHRVVVLLGLDDGAFPRRTGADGDDVLLRGPLVGERDRRGEDRQLFLDAITAATEHLLVLYSGADERSGASRPPAVPVAELLDALDATGAVPGGRRVRDVVVVRHPLQGVDERNFRPGALRRPGPFSFDRVAWGAAVAARSPRTVRPALLRRPLSPPDAMTDVDLGVLAQVLEHPVRGFLRRRLGITLPGSEEEIRDELSIEIDHLERWKVGDRLLRAALEGRPLEQITRAEWLRGVVPPGSVGQGVLHGIREDVAPLVTAVGSRRPDVASRRVDVRIPLPGGRRVVGTVAGLHGDVLVRPVFSKLSAKYRLRTWVHLLALAAAEPGSVTSAVTVGRSVKTWASAGVSRLSAPDRDHAVAVLADLVDLLDRSQREPLPLPMATACAYAQVRGDGADEAAALGTAALEWDRSRDGADDWHAVVWGDAPSFADVLADAPGPDERWSDDTTRFGVLARRLWEPLHLREQVVDE